MAATLLMRQVGTLCLLIELANLVQRMVPAAAGAFAVGITLFPKTALHAEAPDQPEVRVTWLKTYQLRSLIF